MKILGATHTQKACPEASDSSFPLSWNASSFLSSPPSKKRAGSSKPSFHGCLFREEGAEGGVAATVEAEGGGTRLEAAVIVKCVCIATVMAMP